jgi:DNA polymerase (family 10)
MSVNREIASIFKSMADILEMRDVPWKPRAYRNAAKSLEFLGEDVGRLYEKGGLEALKGIEGIGEGLGKKIVEYLESGKIGEYEQLRKYVPAGLLALSEVPGLGPKKAKQLQEGLGVSSLEGLKKAVEEHQVAGLPGFGAKSERNITENLGLPKAHLDRVPREEAEAAARKIISILTRLKEVEEAEAVGSLRRHEETIGDIDILALSEDGEAVMRAFTGLPFVKKTLMRGPKKSSVLLDNGMQADLRVFERKSFGAARLYFTGNKQHNIALRIAAQKKGYKLNEYGLYDKAGKKVAGETEEGVYEKLGFRYIPPEKRRNQGELDAFRAA